MLITQPKSKKIKMALHLHWDQEELFGGKNRLQKSRETVPLKGQYHGVFEIVFFPGPNSSSLGPFLFLDINL